MTLTIRVPQAPAGAASNLIGLLGLAAVVVAVGLLAGWPWALLTGGVLAVGMAVLAQAGAEQRPAVTKRTESAPPWRRAAEGASA